MKEHQSLSHTRWDCKYHVVFIPKRRKNSVFGALRKHLGELFRELAQLKGIEGGRRALDGRSRSYVFEYSAKVFGIERGWLYQREECDFDSPPFRRPAAELHW